jgi:hypothetical protein
LDLKTNGLFKEFGPWCWVADFLSLEVYFGVNGRLGTLAACWLSLARARFRRFSLESLLEM